jgi:hypothetical protein
MKSRKSAGNAAPPASFDCPHARDSSLRRLRHSRAFRRVVCDLQTGDEARSPRNRHQPCGCIRRRHWWLLRRQRRLLATPELTSPLGANAHRLLCRRSLWYDRDRNTDEVQRLHRRLERHMRPHPPLELTDQARTDFGPSPPAARWRARAPCGRREVLARAGRRRTVYPTYGQKAVSAPSRHSLDARFHQTKTRS